jgi:nickel superoxide dismutase
MADEFGLYETKQDKGGKALVNFTLIIAAFAVLMALSVWKAAPASAHCEIPCGIYNDKMRIDMLREDIETIEKSTKSIIELSEAKDKNYNQLVRWVTNKDNHADKFSEVVTQYFMTQRIKPAEPTDAKAYQDYVHKITLLHKMLLSSLKAKQTTDLENIKVMRALVDEFEKAYFPEQK